MRIFLICDETGAGSMREAKEGERLEEYIAETLADEDLMSSMSHGRTEVDPDYPDDEPYVPHAEPMDEDSLAEYKEIWEEYDGKYGGSPITVLSGAHDDEILVQWLEAEVPDDTEAIYFGAAHPDTGGYCGMGGDGAIYMEDEGE